MKQLQQYAKAHHFPRQYADRLLIVEKGRGVTLEDASGRQYLDFAAGIAVNALGYHQKEISKIMAAQAEKLIHISNLFANGPALELSRKLCGASPLSIHQPWTPEANPGYFQAVHFGNSGTEANEAALKYARAYQVRKGNHRARKILAFENGFHGRTMGALSVTATEKYRRPFAPLVPGARFARFNDIAGLKRKLGQRFAAVIVEVVQGEGGLTAMKREFASELNLICRRKDIILIADEVQTGLGRCGTLFASQTVGLEPDIITLAKPLAGGLPLSATLISPKINDSLHLGDHGSTFGGGPVTAAVASYIWDQVTKQEFLEHVGSTATYLQDRLVSIRDDYENVFLPHAPLKGLGMLRGLSVRNPDTLAALISDAMDKGLLILRSGVNLLRFAPPLIIEKKDIDKMESILRKVSEEIK